MKGKVVASHANRRQSISPGKLERELGGLFSTLASAFHVDHRGERSDEGGQRKYVKQAKEAYPSKRSAMT